LFLTGTDVRTRPPIFPAPWSPSARQGARGPGQASPATSAFMRIH